MLGINAETFHIYRVFHDLLTNSVAVNTTSLIRAVNIDICYFIAMTYCLAASFKLTGFYHLFDVQSCVNSTVHIRSL